MYHASFLAAMVIASCGTVTHANCPPPMQVLFSCTLEESDAQVEFCHQILVKDTPSSSTVPGSLKSYSFVRGFEQAELYFIPTTFYFEMFDANAGDRRIYGQSASKFLVTGYKNKDHVYAAMLAVDDDLYDGFLGAELRIYRSADDLEKAQQGTEIAICSPARTKDG